MKTRLCFDCNEEYDSRYKISQYKHFAMFKVIGLGNWCESCFFMRFSRKAYDAMKIINVLSPKRCGNCFRDCETAHFKFEKISAEGNSLSQLKLCPTCHKKMVGEIIPMEQHSE